jgi:hypothetical protein
MKKRPNKGQISLKKIVKITKIKLPFYFWQTVSKKAKWQP